MLTFPLLWRGCTEGAGEVTSRIRNFNQPSECGVRRTRGNGLTGFAQPRAKVGSLAGDKQCGSGGQQCRISES